MAPYLATAAALGLLLVGGIFTYGVNAVEPWEMFNNFVREKATNTIGANVELGSNLGGSSAQAYQNMASAIISAIKDHVDPESQVRVSRLPFDFSGVVWDAEIALEYQSILTVGEAIKMTRQRFRWARFGTATYEGCQGTHKPKRRRMTGVLGWPCESGNALHLQTQTSSGLLLNCIVYYYPRNPSGADPEMLVKASKAALKTIKAATPHSRITSSNSLAPLDLTRLAADYQAAIRKFYSTKKQSHRFLAIAVVPAYEKPETGLGRGVFQSWLGDFAGLAASGGHFAVDHIHVEMPPDAGLDLNSPPVPQGPLFLYFFVAMPLPVYRPYEEPCAQCEG